MLSAAQGDSLLLEYGSQRRTHRILIDGGTAPTYDFLRARIHRIPEGQRRFELLIVTHVDSDHIQGIVRLLQDASLGLDFGDVWFNGWKHLPSDRLGPAEGEMLSALIKKRRFRWNRAFRGKAVQIPDDSSAELPCVPLEGGLELTLLSPTHEELSLLAPVWEKAIREANLVAGDAQGALKLLATRRNLRPADVLGGPTFDVVASAAKKFHSDSTRPNGSSIVVLAEYRGIACVLAGDAHAGVLLRTVPRLLAMRRLGVLDAFKLPHHGSKNNVSTELVAALPARRYLFSTSGAIFEHPDREAVSRVLIGTEGRKRLYFNYSTVFNEMWRDRKLLGDYRATATFPNASGPGITVDLEQ